MPNEPAQAAKGAAELDFEFYVRDLLKGNPKEGSISSSPVSTVPRPPPRRIQPNTVRLLLDETYSPDGLVMQTLFKTIKSHPTKIDLAQIQNTAIALREKVAPSFYVQSPWKEESCQDSYYLDLTSYALWKTLTPLLNNLQRDAWIRELGRSIYQKQKEDQAINLSKKEKGISATIPTVQQSLQTFQSWGLVRDFKIQSKEGNFVLDEIDDEALEAGATVDCVISLIEPATLGASLQLTGEQSRFIPDFVGPTLAALWEDAGFTSYWETFFVDSQYRPNPKDYFPNEELIQFTISKKE